MPDEDVVPYNSVRYALIKYDEGTDLIPRWVDFQQGLALRGWGGVSRDHGTREELARSGCFPVEVTDSACQRFSYQVCKKRKPAVLLA
jgi:hypothetical protein